MKLALSTLCENPRRRTGLTTFFHEFIRHALAEFPEVRWVIFVGQGEIWPVTNARVEVVTDFPANDRRGARLWADHFLVAAAAKRRGAQALLTVGYMPLRHAGLPVILHVFALPNYHGGWWRGLYRRLTVTRGLREAALVITNSSWTASKLGPVRSRVVVSHEGVQQDRFTAEGPAGNAVFPDLPPAYLLWSSNFYAYKRAELAVAAYARLPADLREAFPLVMIGGDWQGGRERVIQAVREGGVEGQVRLLGWVSDDVLPALYRGARALLLSTAEETFGRCVTEAMACGCPCVLQELPVLREVTAGAALFTDFTNPVAAAKAIERVCRDDIFAERLRAGGLERAREFSFRKLARSRVPEILSALGAKP